MMIERCAMPPTSEALGIFCFGYAEGTEDTRWGRGSRSVYILHFVLDGAGFFNGRRVEKNCGFVIRPDQSVEYHPDESAPWKYFWVIFSGDQSENICKNHISSNRDGIFSFSFDATLSDLSARVLADGEPLSQSYALALFFYILSLGDSASPRDSNRYVSEAKNYINLNFYRPISITELAAAQNISDRYLYNLFIRHEGISPKQYLNSVRLEYAKKQLRETEHTVSEIALSVGFFDSLAFSRFFSKKTGISPTEYRKKIKGRDC